MASRFRALLAIALSTLIVSGGSITAYTITRRIQASRPTNPHYTIRYLEQTCSSLPTPYLAMLLDLCDTNLYALNLDEARHRLLSSPLIKAATLHRRPPDTLSLDLSVREPVATLPEYSNFALDLEGQTIPMLPFYSDQGLPKLILGPGRTPESTYHALNLLHLCPHATAIDTSRLTHASPGTREIILTLDGHILRLSPTHYPSALDNYTALRPHLLPQAIVDLRLEHLAYIGAYP